MSEDPRCCGTGTCIINEDGLCWCGQRWNGEKMCFQQQEISATVNCSESQSLQSKGLSTD